jgi:hypothetical protein
LGRHFATAAAWRPLRVKMTISRAPVFSATRASVDAIASRPLMPCTPRASIMAAKNLPW